MDLAGLSSARVIQLQGRHQKDPARQVCRQVLRKKKQPGMQNSLLSKSSHEGIRGRDAVLLEKGCLSAPPPPKHRCMLSSISGNRRKLKINILTSAGITNLGVTSFQFIHLQMAKRGVDEQASSYRA